MKRLFLFSCIIMSSFVTTTDLNAEIFKLNDIEKVKSDLLIADSCGGGGHGARTVASKKEKKKKQAKAKLIVKKRILAKKASSGESTSKLEIEIKELEALLLEEY